MGTDIGVLSYNETPLKQIIRDSISVVSCNFETMATEMAAFIKEQKTIKTVIPIEFNELPRRKRTGYRTPANPQKGVAGCDISVYIFCLGSEHISESSPHCHIARPC